MTTPDSLLSPDPSIAAGSHGLIVEAARCKWGLATVAFDEHKRYRYGLSRIWDERGRRLLWVLLNPSIADACSDDPTVRRVLAFSRHWGYGAAEIVNLFALRATNPQTLLSVDDPIGTDNDSAIERAITASDRVVIAWGNLGSIGGTAEHVLSYLKSLSTVLLALGITEAGQPRHPLYVRSSVEPVGWSSLTQTQGTRVVTSRSSAH